MTAARYPAPSLVPAWALVPSIGMAVVRGAAAAVREVLRDHALRRRYAADLQHLHAMRACELRDLGLTHADLPALTRDPVLGDDWRSWHQWPR